MLMFLDPVADEATLKEPSVITPATMSSLNDAQITFTNGL